MAWSVCVLSPFGKSTAGVRNVLNAWSISACDSSGELANLVLRRCKGGVVGALVFAAVFSLQLRLRILPSWEAVPFELLLALPYLIVIAALAVSGRNVAHRGGYLKHYRRKSRW